MPGYPSDVTDEEWALLAPFFARPDPRGHPGRYAKRDVVNAIFYVVKGGILWRMLPFSGDQGYSGTTVQFVENLFGLRIDIAAKPSHGFKVIPKRWIVERTWAWVGGFRRLAKEFEILTQSAENMIRIAMIKITVAKCT